MLSRAPCRAVGRSERLLAGAHTVRVSPPVALEAAVLALGPLVREYNVLAEADLVGGREAAALPEAAGADVQERHVLLQIVCGIAVFTAYLAPEWGGAGAKYRSHGRFRARDLTGPGGKGLSCGGVDSNDSRSVSLGSDAGVNGAANWCLNRAIDRSVNVASVGLLWCLAHHHCYEVNTRVSEMIKEYIGE